jgi:hypothetical protein
MNVFSPMRRRRLLFLMAGGLACGATASVPESADPRERLESVRIGGIPHVRQRPDFCGEACVEMYTSKLRHPVSQDAVFDLSGVDPSLGRGCHAAELVRALERIGFEPGPVWRTVERPEIEGQAAVQGEWSILHARLLRGAPSIVCMHYDDTPETTEHFRLIVGYDAEADEVIFHEPAQDEGAYRRMTRDSFFELWPISAGEGRTQLIQMGLEHDHLADSAPREGLGPADYVQRVIALRDRLDPGEFDVRAEAPFVVVGDDGPARLEAYCAGVIRWAVEHLESQFFEAGPSHIVEIYLFRNDASYRENAKKLFRDEPDTPYGYYSPDHEALVMNIGTGGGTLVHEIVHPFMASNFPACPSWFNEGLASLYEQSAEREGKIVGLTNWRLPGLQSAIRDEQVPPFAELLASGDRPFYDADPGTNYAQARYLCYWLQERGLLEEFYRAFVGGAAQDATGYATLSALVSRETGDGMRDFQAYWERWVLGLTQS